jgi:hypothetical protein
MNLGVPMSNETESEILNLTVRLPKILRDQMVLKMSGPLHSCVLYVQLQNYANNDISHEGICICRAIDHDPEAMVQANYRYVLKIDWLESALKDARLQVERLKKLLEKASNDKNDQADSTISDAEALSPIALAKRKKSGR